MINRAFKFTKNDYKRYIKKKNPGSKKAKALKIQKLRLYIETLHDMQNLQLRKKQTAYFEEMETLVC